MPKANAAPSLKGALASIDVQSIVGDLTGVLQGVAAEVTDPRFQTILTQLATDAILVQQMKANGADPKIIAEAEEAIRARTQSIVKVPGLIVAGRQTQVLGMISKALGLVSTVAFNFLRAYAGLPPAPAGDGQQQSSGGKTG